MRSMGASAYIFSPHVILTPLTLFARIKHFSPIFSYSYNSVVFIQSFALSGQCHRFFKKMLSGVKISICFYPFPTAAAAKSLQSCPTLCDPIDGSPSGSLVPGILQAGTLEWVAISFSNALYLSNSSIHLFRRLIYIFPFGKILHIFLMLTLN